MDARHADYRDGNSTSLNLKVARSGDGVNHAQQIGLGVTWITGKFDARVPNAAYVEQLPKPISTFSAGA
jgi:hypothetical protein